MSTKIEELTSLESSPPIALPLKKKLVLLSAVIGLGVGFLSFQPILLLFLYISYSISHFFNHNPNMDDFISAWLCFIPALIVSLIGGIKGGEIGYRKGHKNLVALLGAIFGGLCGPLITLLPASIIIIIEWAVR